MSKMCPQVIFDLIVILTWSLKLGLLEDNMGKTSNSEMRKYEYILGVTEQPVLSHF